MCMNGPGALPEARCRDHSLPDVFAPDGMSEGAVVAAHGGADAGGLGARVAFAVEAVAQQAVEHADLTEDVQVQVVRLAVRALLDAELVPVAVALAPALVGVGGAAHEAQAADRGDQDGNV